MSTRTFALDASTGAIKRANGLAALTSTAYVGTQYDQRAASVTDGMMVINLETCKVSAGNEVYTFRVVGSNAADRSDGQVLAMMLAGHAGTQTIETRNTIATDRLEIPFRTDKNDTSFRYIDLHLTVAGTSPSVAFGAYMTKEIV
jgi:hypothetical protein